MTNEVDNEYEPSQTNFTELQIKKTFLSGKLIWKYRQQSTDQFVFFVLPEYFGVLISASLCMHAKS